jgi:hypothetical protein
VPHYFFHLRGRDSVLRDEAGLKLPDPEAAWYQAVRAARELLQAEILIGSSWQDQAIEIADAQGSLVDWIPLSAIARYTI